MKTKIIVILVVVFTFIILIGNIIFKNKEKIILTKFGTTQWELYKSHYRNIVSSNYSFKPSKYFYRVGIYELSWNGKCDYYIFNNRKQKLEKYHADDIVTNNIWKYKNDSTFMLNGLDYKTLSFKNDSIVLLWNNPNWLDTLILVRSKKKYNK